MAKLEQKLIGDFDNIVDLIENGIKSGSVSATLEGRSDFLEGDCRCAVRVFERYSYLGGNRLSLNVTLFQKADGPIHLSAISAGGSQALYLKINTFGEQAFLDKLKEITFNIQQF